MANTMIARNFDFLVKVNNYLQLNLYICVNFNYVTFLKNIVRGENIYGI